MIDVDLSDLVPHEVLGILSPATTEAVLDGLAASARVKWIRLARQELKSSRQEYIDGLSEIESRPGLRFITLEGWLANAIETGLEAWDLRDTVLGGKATHYSEDGNMYAHVPFRHGTPGSGGQVGAPMGSAYGPRGKMSLAGGTLNKEQAAEFGKELYQAAKRLRTRAQGQPPGAMREGAVQGAYRAAGGRGSPLLRSHHLSSIYAGMRRERKPYVRPSGKTTTQTQYTTWRTISETGGDPQSWWHPGIQARSLSERVGEHVSQIAGKVVQQAIKSAMKGR